MKISQFSWIFPHIVVVLLSQYPRSAAADSIQTFVGEDSRGKAIRLRDDRRPALYTKNFGDCQGGLLLNITRFDAGFYKDNMTVAFHFEGTTAVQEHSVMLYIGVFAYGEERFELTIDPCLSNIRSLCPMRAAAPIQANGIMPVGPEDTSGIPDIAFSIPDFEGQAILRVFSNSTQSQIGCYSAVVTNGATFSHPLAVGGVLGGFTVVSVLSSLAVAIYGTNASSTRKHYAHSLSVFVVFSTFQHIYFTGALPMNWPSVLAAFWSNYAWSAGMIYNENMQNSIGNFTRIGEENTSTADGHLAGSTSQVAGGGYHASRIYQRALSPEILNPELLMQWGLSKQTESLLQARSDTESPTSFPWYGSLVKPGLPLPGNFSGFSGTLSMQGIPASNAFMTGFLWFLILFGIIAASMIVLKSAIEGLRCLKAVKTDRLAVFRNHWLRFTRMAMERTLFLAFFLVVFLTLSQFTIGGGSGVTAVAALVFVFFVTGLFGLVAYAIYYRLRMGQFVVQSGRLTLQGRVVLKVIPWLKFYIENESEVKNNQPAPFTLYLPWWSIQYTNPTSVHHYVHDDGDYLLRFAWLSARFRRTRWWFFGAWLTYEFVRACLFGVASSHPMSQIIALFAVELIALIITTCLKPFEATRLNMLMVYCLGFSKVSTVALCSAFHPRFNLGCITTTVIGIIIIAIQAILTIILLIAIVVGAASSYASITRYYNDEAFKPRGCLTVRTKYLAHVNQRALDLQPRPLGSDIPSDIELKEPTFNVSAVRRIPKIEDEARYPESSRSHNGQNAFIPYREPTAFAAVTVARSRAQSTRSSRSSYSSLPYGVRPARSSIQGSRKLMNPTWQRPDSGESINSLLNTSPSRRIESV